MFPAVTKGVGVKHPIDFFIIIMIFIFFYFFQEKLCIKILCILLTIFPYSSCSTACLLPCLAVVLSTGRTVCSSRLRPIWGLLESCCVCWQSGTSFPSELAPVINITTNYILTYIFFFFSFPFMYSSLECLIASRRLKGFLFFFFSNI